MKKQQDYFYDLTIIVHELMLLCFTNFLCPKFQTENLLTMNLFMYIVKLHSNQPDEHLQ